MKKNIDFSKGIRGKFKNLKLKVNGESESIDCSCQNQVKRLVSDKLPIAGQLIEVIDAPAYVCLDCGEIYFEGEYILDLEKKALATSNKESK